MNNQVRFLVNHFTMRITAVTANSTTTTPTPAKARSFGSAGTSCIGSSDAVGWVVGCVTGSVGWGSVGGGDNCSSSRCSISPQVAQTRWASPAVSTVGSLMVSQSPKSCPSGCTMFPVSLWEHRLHWYRSKPGSVQFGAIVTVIKS